MSNEINILMREMSEGMNLSKEEVDFLTKKETFAMRLDRISQTFSHERLIRLTGMFHLWLLGRINAKWRPSGYSKDSVPETFNVTGVIDWRNDE